MLIDSPSVFRGWEIRMISLKSVYRDVLMIVITFIDYGDVKLHVRRIANNDAAIRS